MWRSRTRGIALLLPLLLYFVSTPALCQSDPPEEILQWETDMLRFDSLNRLEESDAGTLLVTGSGQLSSNHHFRKPASIPDLLAF